MRTLKSYARNEDAMPEPEAVATSFFVAAGLSSSSDRRKYVWKYRNLEVPDVQYRSVSYAS